MHPPTSHSVDSQPKTLLMSLFQHPIQDPYYICCYVFLVSSNLWQFLNVSLSFTTDTFGNSTGQFFFSMALSFVFSWLGWSYALFGRMLQRWCSSLSAWYQGIYDITVYYWVAENINSHINAILDDQFTLTWWCIRRMGEGRHRSYKNKLSP